uniref:SFRICE_001543 n=1 Tax=Spodoptera frugiperda TaxID=7108 RepID=A0A2H1W5N6_SPOFR
MAALKTTLVLLLIAFAMFVTIEAVTVTRVPQCDQVCGPVDTERNACCKAHGYVGYSHCVGGGMRCYK